MAKKRNNYSIIISIILLITMFGIGILFGYYLISQRYDKSSDDLVENIDDLVENIDVKYNNGNKYYIITGYYEGDYDYQVLNPSIEQIDLELFNTSKILSYHDYSLFCDQWDFEQAYTDTTKNYMIIACAVRGHVHMDARIVDVLENEGKLLVYIWDDFSGVVAGDYGYFIAIPIDSNISQNEIIYTYTAEEYFNIKRYGVKNNPNDRSIP